MQVFELTVVLLASSSAVPRGGGTGGEQFAVVGSDGASNNVPGSPVVDMHLTAIAVCWVYCRRVLSC